MTLRSCLGDVVLYAAMGLIAPPLVLVLGPLNCFIGAIVLAIAIISSKYSRQYNNDTRTVAKGAA